MTGPSGSAGFYFGHRPFHAKGVQQRLDLAQRGPKGRVLVQPNDHALVRAVRVQLTQIPGSGLRTGAIGAATASSRSPRSVVGRSSGAFLSALGLVSCTRGLSVRVAVVVGGVWLHPGLPWLAAGVAFGLKLAERWVPAVGVLMRLRYGRNDRQCRHELQNGSSQLSCPSVFITLATSSRVRENDTTGVGG